MIRGIRKAKQNGVNQHLGAREAFCQNEVRNIAYSTKAYAVSTMVIFLSVCSRKKTRKKPLRSLGGGGRRSQVEVKFGRRPEPVGRSYTPDPGDDAPARKPSRLAPLKKKKTKSKISVPDSDDELYRY